MPRQRSKFERYLSWNKKNKPVIEIFRILNHSKRRIYRVLARDNNFDRKARFGRPRVASFQTNLKVGRLVFEKNMSTIQINNDLGASVSKDTMHRHIRDCKNIVIQKMFCKLSLKSHHKPVWLGLEITSLTGTSGSPYHLVMIRSGIWMVLMAGIVTGMILKKSYVPFPLDD